MAPSKRRRPRKLARAARRAAEKRVNTRVRSASKTSASKTKAKKPGKARGVKSARPAKTIGHKAVGRRDRTPKAVSKAVSKAGPKVASRSKPKVKAGAGTAARRLAYRERHLLTSVRRPKAAKPRGPARSRVAPHRRHAKPNGTNGASALRYEIRDFTPADADAVNTVALAAFEQYRGAYSDWPDFANQIGAMTRLAENGEIIVAESGGRVAGAVAYVGPNAAKPAMFDPAWPVIRMLVVDPSERGQGLGRALTEECIRRARRDGAAQIALHTSPIMQVALAMHLRQGFMPLRETAPVFGVPYCIYLKSL
jgi:predicted N-acetyltransferase YhbS